MICLNDNAQCSRVQSSRTVVVLLCAVLIFSSVVTAFALVQATPNQYGKLSTVMQPPKPNPKCMVCGHALACVYLDLQTFTFQQLLERVLKKDMAFSHPTVMCDNFLYEEGDDLDEDEVDEYSKLLPKAIACLPGNIAHNSRLEVSDQTQSLKVTIVLQQQVRAVQGGFTMYGLRSNTLTVSLKHSV
jgi:hypothetical protein